MPDDLDLPEDIGAVDPPDPDHIDPADLTAGQFVDGPQDDV